MKIQHLGAFAALTLTLGVASTAAHAEPFDEQFIDSMMPHHESAVVMAQMAVTQAKYPEVRALARGIITDQKQEIAYMGQLRKRFYGSAMSPGMSGMNTSGSMGGMKMSGDKMMMSGTLMGLPMKGVMDMGRLRNAKGTQFDRMFLEMMIPHHAGAILMGDEALQQSARPEIRRLGAKIVDAQAGEIGEMHAIHDQHFGHIKS